MSSTNSTEETKRQRPTAVIVLAYPLCVLLIGVILNLRVFEVSPIAVALPATERIYALLIAAALLVINHTWLMTTTELTRGRFGMHSTLEEWTASGTGDAKLSYTSGYQSKQAV